MKLNFINWIIHLPVFGMVHYHFLGIINEVCTETEAGLTLYWWQRLIFFDSSRLRVNRVIFSWITNYIRAYHICPSIAVGRPDCMKKPLACSPKIIDKSLYRDSTQLYSTYIYIYFQTFVHVNLFECLSVRISSKKKERF